MAPSSWLYALLLLPIIHTAAIDNNKLRGVRPDILPRYVPSGNGKWTCLDGSKEIAWTAVNDDYCDCEDGSDEPGTSACPNGSFHCLNVGHIGMDIPSSRVDDGICESACCDGSDEPPGVCGNTCKVVGDIHRKKLDAEHAVRKKGAKIRASYIAFAQKERSRLESLVSTTQMEVGVREKEVQRLKSFAEHAEELSAATIKRKKESPLYQSILTHSHMLRSLNKLYTASLEREKAQGEILEALRTGYNPNYQDMAVLDAVRSWDTIRPREEGKEDAVEAEDAEVEAEEEEDQQQKKEEGGEDGLLSSSEVQQRMQTLLNTNHELLLLEHEKYVKAPTDEAKSILFNLAEYLPDGLVASFESFVGTLRGILRLFGIESLDTSEEATRARKAYDDASRALRHAQDEKANAEEQLKKLFAVNEFGALGEWKKLDGTCLEKEIADYTYELCLFHEAKQRPTHGGASHRLGSFSSWNPSPDVLEGSPEYYSKQVYANGDFCWNGPPRSVVVVWRCGTENAIETVDELQKCEYQFTGTSPALCLPLDDTSATASTTPAVVTDKGKSANEL